MARADPGISRGGIGSFALLNIVSPDVLVLGEKDYQQLILVKRLVRDLQLPVQVSRDRPTARKMASR
ncbi:MAG: hypothetical protein CM1200mP36_09360 [Gammaproteobacteria bacterium]|nr:MAG: hypothetical protein CM1200mP36_09360 [Gammaproteobacteria bacterium]